MRIGLPGWLSGKESTWNAKGIQFDPCLIIWVKFAHSSPFSSLIPKLSMFTLVTSCFISSNLSWFMDLTFQVPMQYCLIASDFTSITGHIHNWALFLLWLHLFVLSEVISSVFSNGILASTNLESSSFSVLSFCLFILFMGFSRQEY